jgi:hypothetical protein
VDTNSALLELFHHPTSYGTRTFPWHVFLVAIE